MNSILGLLSPRIVHKRRSPLEHFQNHFHTFFLISQKNMDSPGYWMSALQADPALVISYSNIYSSGFQKWVIVNRTRDGSLMIAENPVTKVLSIWAQREMAVALGIPSAPNCAKSSNLSQWSHVAIVTDDWLSSLNGAVGADFDALADLRADPKRIGVSVLFQRGDASPAVLRIDAYIAAGEVVVSTKWDIHPSNVHELEKVMKVYTPLLERIKAHASEIDGFLSANGVQVSFDNPCGYIRRDFHKTFVNSDVNSGIVRVSSLLQSGDDSGVGGGYALPSFCLSDKSLSRDISTSPDTGSSVAGHDMGSSVAGKTDAGACLVEAGGCGNKRGFFEVEERDTGVSLRGRRRGSKDTKKRTRGQTLSKNCYEDVLSTLVKLEILIRKNCDKVGNSKDVCNQNICALLTLTRSFDMWYLNKQSTLLDKRFRELLAIVRPLLCACPLLLVDIPAEFCANVKDAKTMELYVHIKTDIVEWFRCGCTCDFFRGDIIGDGKSVVGSPSETDWLDKNRQFLLDMGISKLRDINNVEKQRRLQQKLGNAALGEEVKLSSLATLQERLAFANDHILHGMRAEAGGGDVDESGERVLRGTYHGFQSVLDKAVELYKETSEITARLKTLEQKRKEILTLFQSTYQASADFTRTYIPQFALYPENDVRDRLDEILRDAGQTLMTAPQFSARGFDEGGAAGGGGGGGAAK